MEATTRLNKAISSTGYCSRREADKLIEQGVVTINGKKASLGERVSEDDQIEVNGELITKRNNPVYIALHKPRGIICTTDPKAMDNVVEYIGHEERIFPVGRLDVASEGLLLMTNDGDIVNSILRARYHHEKEYLVTVDKPITEKFLSNMSKGVKVLGTITRECEVQQVDEFQFRIILTQGMNRQIRRMCEHLGYKVKRLIRERIMNITLDGLKYGHWRYLTDKELDALHENLIKGSERAE